MRERERAPGESEGCGSVEGEGETEVSEKVIKPWVLLTC